MSTDTRRPTTAAAPLDTDWRAYAACAGTDPEVFFPIGNQYQIAAQNAVAKRVCAVCRVRTRCLDWALDSGQNTGVWGGLSEDERRHLARKPDSTMTMCLNRQAWIEEQIAGGVTQRSIADELGVDHGVLNRAIQRFRAERALETSEAVNAA